MNKYFHYVVFLPLVIVACSGIEEGNQATNLAISQPMTISLPIDSNKWTTWYCTDGSRLRTRYHNDLEQMLLLETHDYGEQVLKKEPSTNPVVFSNTMIAFYSDGAFAAIGSPLSDEIYTGGCSPDRITN